VFDRLPGRLQQQPLLRVHRPGLTRGDLEELRVELAHVPQESAVPGRGRTRSAGPAVGRAVEAVEVPAPVLGEFADRVHFVRDQLPQGRRGIDAPRIPAGHPHDGYGFAGCGFQFGDALTGLLKILGDPFQVIDELFLFRHVGHAEEGG